MPRLASSVKPNAGDIDVRTLKLRSPISLTPRQRMQAKEWRKVGLEFWEIAKEMKLNEEDIRQALANIRMKRMNPPRKTLNVSVAAAHHVKMLQKKGESVWQTVNRIFGIPNK